MSSQLYPPTEQDIQAMVQSMEQLRLCDYATGMTVFYRRALNRAQLGRAASMVALMIYDIIINLEREVSHTAHFCMKRGQTCGDRYP